MSEDNAQESKSTASPPSALRKRDRAKFVAREIRSSVQEALSSNDPNPEPQPGILQDPAFDPQKVLRPEAAPDTSLRDKLSLTTHHVANSLKNPKAAHRNRYTRNVASKIASHAHDWSTAYDEELLDAHESLTDIQHRQHPTGEDGSSSDAAEHVMQEADAQARVQRIEERRGDLKSSWILGRHIKRARAIRSAGPRPVRAQFAITSESGQPWYLPAKEYVGHLALWYTYPLTAHRIDDFDEPPFDLGELALTCERLAAASSPWQFLFVRVREIYCWKNPKRTFEVMLIYWLFWYCQQIMAFGIAFVIYITLRNKIMPETVQQVRERVRRSRDQSQKVRAWNELVQKHGRNDWVEPFFDQVGPNLQMQLGDLTMFLEKLQSFYQWELPQQTWLTLSFISIWLLFLLLASTNICMRVFWFVIGFVFFYSFPIATNYPKYRHVVNPLSWMFWSIPDAAEMAIYRLQQKASAQIDSRIPVPKQEEGTTSRFEDKANESEGLKFEVILLPSNSPTTVTVKPTYLKIERESQPVSKYFYKSLLEIRKVKTGTDTDQSSNSLSENQAARPSHPTRILERVSSVQLSPTGLGFVFQRDESSAKVSTPATSLANSNSVGVDQEHTLEFTLVLNKRDRDKIFAVVLGWSNLKWQPLFSLNRQNRLGSRPGEAENKSKRRWHGLFNENLDDAIKKGLS